MDKNKRITPTSPVPLRNRLARDVPVLVIILMGLAACGGGGATTAQAPAATTEETQAASTASTTVPSGWKPRAPTSELINGIIVPPEPAPSVNNATIGGVDSNADGVRDDVERVIAKKFGSIPQKHVNASRYAAAEQAVLTDPSELSIEKFSHEVGCNPLSSSELDPTTAQLLNTGIRRSAFNEAVSGMILEGCK